ncbi:unnamed protein product, partial [Symbiodinium sp. KB8]
ELWVVPPGTPAKGRVVAAWLSDFVLGFRATLPPDQRQERLDEMGKDKMGMAYVNLAGMAAAEGNASSDEAEAMQEACHFARFVAPDWLLSPVSVDALSHRWMCGAVELQIDSMCAC